jgi:hypothetical protein
MKPAKQLPARALINLSGLAAMVVIVLVGLLTFAAPQVTEAFTTQQNKRNTEQTNSMLAIQLASLQQEQQNLTAIQNVLAQLRRQIPAEQKLDQVFEEIINAASATSAEIVSINAGSQAQWIPRSSSAANSLVSRTAGGEAEELPDPTSPDPNDPKKSVSFNVIANVKDISSAGRLLDSLANAWRLLSIESVSINEAPGEGAGMLINLNLATFVFVGSQ